MFLNLCTKGHLPWPAICYNNLFVVFFICPFIVLVCKTHLSWTVEFFRQLKVFSQNRFYKSPQFFKIIPVYKAVWLICFIFYFQLMGFCVACYVIYVFTEEDDSCKYRMFSFIIIYIVHRKVFSLVSSQVVWQLCTVFLRCLLNISVSVLLSYLKCNVSYFIIRLHFL